MKIIISFDEEYAPDMGALLVKFGKEVPMEIEIQGKTDEVLDLADFLENHDIRVLDALICDELDQIPF
jgi:hypothetical protein